jgi:hypothetical protein
VAQERYNPFQRLQFTSLAADTFFAKIKGGKSNEEEAGGDGDSNNAIHAVTLTKPRNTLHFLEAQTI